MIYKQDVSLVEMLEAREARAEKQKKLISEYNLPLISFTINIPGAYKMTPTSEAIFWEGCKELFKRLSERNLQPVYWEMHTPVTGCEAYIVIESDEQAVKMLTLEIETQHPLGRLMDIDVFGCDGNLVSRGDLNYPKRKCLLCDKEAFVCARSRAHSLELLIDKIQSITEGYA